jgi:hypothetical protein
MNGLSSILVSCAALLAVYYETLLFPKRLTIEAIARSKLQQPRGGYLTLAHQEFIPAGRAESAVRPDRWIGLRLWFPLCCPWADLSVAYADRRYPPLFVSQ